MSAAVLDLTAVTAADAAAVGGKAANLGEMVAADFPVPPGFVVPAASYLDAMDTAGVRAELAALHERTLAAADDPAALTELCARMAELVRKAGTSAPLAEQIRAAYRRLCDGAGDGTGGGTGTEVATAVRSSAVGEDAADASFAGMNASFTNVRGGDEVVRKVDECWASLVGPRVVAYRAARGMTREPAIAVVVQVMVASERAGVAFTADPRTGARDVVVVEAALGQGEVVVSGAVEPDTYEVAADALEVRAARIGRQSHEIVRGPDGTDLTVTLDVDRGAARVLSDPEVLDIARLALRVQEHYGVPQDVEWAIDGDGLWLVQTRPITTLRPEGAGQTGGAASGAGGTGPQGDGAPLVRGIAATAGRVAGRVRVLHDPADGAALESGEVLVAPMTNPDWLPTMRRAAAVVTDSGGTTCHAAIAARELGVPCVVGTHSATEVLRTGQVVTVDGALGEVLDGDRT
ncbi:MAG TPA: PEP/pyruvate-binding domain-containing protein, partial [Pseudonocardia sp.]|nr:PEP/pyruvate-binding domain-containing protein [Pseudonocardia sp.]